MHPLRQAGQQFQNHGCAGLHREMPARGLFRQTLAMVGQHEVSLKVAGWTGHDPGCQDTRYSSRYR